MTTLCTSARYPLPERLQARLDEVMSYWRSIQRGYHVMPYWDDVDMVKLGRLEDDLLLLDVLDSPARFRFNLVGRNVTGAYGKELEGLFADEVALHAPLQELPEQCRASVDESAPTCFRHRPDSPGDAAYDRLLLPLWGNGRIEMLLGGIAREADTPDA